MPIGEWLRRLRFWFRRDRLANDLDEEMRLHLELRAEANQARGMSADAARQSARRQFGNPLALREAGRDAWGLVALERLLQDLKYGVRQLARQRGVTAAALVTLALGIGANTALLTAINALLLRPPQAADPDRLVWLGTTSPDDRALRALSYPDLQIYREQQAVFQGVVATTWVHLTAGGPNPERVAAIVASGDYFKVLGVDAAQGRVFDPAGVQAFAGRLVVLGDGFWRRRYGAAPVVGGEIALNGQPFTIAGVLPQGFHGLETPDSEEPAVWLPLEAAPIAMPDRRGLLNDPGESWLWTAARLQPGVSLRQAAATAAQIAARAPSAALTDRDRRSATVMPIRGGLHPRDRAEVAPVLWLLMIVPGLVLVVACANVATLLLARGLARRRELAVRQAIGATRGRLVRQLLTEGGLMALAGGVAALGISAAFVRTIGAIADVPPALLNTMTLDARVFALTMSVALVSVIFFALSPALSATRLPLATAMQDLTGVVGASGGRRRRLGRTFVVAEIAATTALLVTAGLIVQSVGKALRVDPGFDATRLMTFSYDVPSGRSARDQQLAFDRLLLERVRQVPGVETAAHAMPAPFSGNMVSDELVAELGVRQTLRASWSAVSAGYFGTIGLPLADGRGFTDQDVATHAPVAIINETLAEQLAPDGHVLGRRFRLGGADTPWRSVVGVARDSKHDMLTEDPRPFVYLPWGQTPPWRISVLVRLTGEPAAIIPLVSAAVRQLDATLPLYRVSTMHDQIGRTMDVHQAASSFLALFGGLALLLAAVGIYGVTAHGVTLRTREIGIRMSFGAETAQVKRMFVGEGLRLSAVGIAIGLAISAAAADLLASFLFGLGATDPVTFAGVAALLCSVAMVASYLPARRAAGIDPLRALRHD